jgi:hypothetical protein
MTLVSFASIFRVIPAKTSWKKSRGTTGSTNSTIVALRCWCRTKPPADRAAISTSWLADRAQAYPELVPQRGLAVKHPLEVLLAKTKIGKYPLEMLTLILRAAATT